MDIKKIRKQIETTRDFAFEKVKESFGSKDAEIIMQLNAKVSGLCFLSEQLLDILEEKQGV